MCIRDSIKPGDVDDDAILGSSSSLETAIMTLSDVLINNGESYEATLEYEGEELSRAVEVHLYFDSNLIDVTELYVDNPDMNLSYNIDNPGEIHLTMTKSNGGAGFLFAGENLINIKFQANANGLLSQANFESSIRNSYLLGLDYELTILTVENGGIINTGVDDTTAHQNLFDVYPNPASDIVNFDFHDKVPSDFTIQLLDASGKLVSEISNQTNINVSTLASGMYLYRLIDGDQAYTGRLSIIN